MTINWYSGCITKAVTLSKQRKNIFVVFIEAEGDELSEEMAAAINDKAVVSRLGDPTKFFTLKLKSGSIDYNHFARIFQFVPVPSLFFIGRNGTPLEVVCAGVQAADLAIRIDRILQHEDAPLVQPSTSSQHITAQTANLLQSEAAASASAYTPANTAANISVNTPVNTPANTSVNTPANTAADKNSLKTKADEIEPETSSGPAAKVQKTEHRLEEVEMVCVGDVCERRPRAEPQPVAGSSTAPLQEATPQQSPAVEAAGSIEEKLDKAKELIEARRREKADKEKELEKQKELERRAAGQGVVELKRWQADQELKQIQEERKRERMENNLARQRILDQIAQDRAERRARDTAPLPTTATATPTTTSQQPYGVTQNRPTSGDAASGSRIQFKLPDGTSHSANFSATDTLTRVHDYVADNLNMSQSSFSLWTAFPRRELAGGAATLRELQLAPSAALLVLPRGPSPVVVVVTFITQLFTSLVMDPSQQLYTWIRARLFPPPAPSAQDPSARTPSPPRSRPGPGPRRRGNVHRLTGDRNSDDDNNTWNGNSTQQM